MVSKVAFGASSSGGFKRLFGRSVRRPHVTVGRRVFAVGDIHGRIDLLDQILEMIKARSAVRPLRNVLIFLGDYIDRGVNSKAVLERLLSLDWPEWEFVFLRGNHDQALLDFLESPTSYRAWRSFGAAETLLSYGVRPPQFDDERAFANARNDLAEKCPARHIEFLKSLRYLYEDSDYIFVHAGLRPGLALHRQSHRDLLWIREDFLEFDGLTDRVVVHGHTPSEHPVKRPNRLCLDTGAYATGRLTAVVLEEDEGKFLSTVPPGA